MYERRRPRTVPHRLRCGPVLARNGSTPREAIPLGSVPFQRQQIVQLLCGPFTGPGSTAMVMSFRAPTCWGEQGWAMFRRVGGAWRLVKVQRGTFLFPFIVVDNDIQENAPAFRRGDSRCCPSGGRQGRIWHWNGRRLAQSPISWMLLTAETVGAAEAG